ncbi:ABC-type Fe3+-hydroxamate transport system substrate-binding protein [Pedobacter sp. UYEF25]
MAFLDHLTINLLPAKIEELTERLELVEHKIKFMDKPPVTCVNADGSPNFYLSEEIAIAGGMVGRDVFAAIFLIFYEPEKTLIDLMREVPAALNPEWPAVKNNRVILLNDDINRSLTAENAVSLIEDMAEMIHPGTFIFGHEGHKWIRFSV